MNPEEPEYVSVWGCRRSATNLCQKLVDEHTTATPIQHADAWKHGYPHEVYPDAVSLVVTKHPMAWLLSEESWRFRGSLPARLAHRLRDLAANVVAHRDPFRAVGMKWGLALDKWAALMEVWARLEPCVVVRFEDLLRDPLLTFAPLEGHGVQVDDAIELPGGRVQPTKNGPTETDNSFDAAYYLDHEWAAEFSARDRIGIDHYIERHGQRSTWEALGYNTYRPWVSDAAPDDARSLATTDNVRFYRPLSLAADGGPTDA